MKPARFLLPISVLILGMSQSALAEKDGTAETVEAEKKEAPALGQAQPWSIPTSHAFRPPTTTLRLVVGKCGNQRG